MKKVLLLITVLMMTVSMSAQNLTASKTTDNFYIGINGGVATKTTGHAWLKGLNPNAGLRIGRWFTPVFGFAIDGNAYFFDVFQYTDMRSAFGAAAAKHYAHFEAGRIDSVVALSPCWH